MKLSFCFLVAISSLFFISCQKKNISEQPVAEVGSYTLTFKEFSQNLNNQLKRYKPIEVSKKNFVNKVKTKIIDDFLYASLIKKWAQENSIFIHPKEVEQEFINRKNQYPSDDKFKKSLSINGHDYSAWKKKVAFQLLESKVVNELKKKLPVPDIKEQKIFYKNNPELFRQPKAILLRQLVFRQKEDAKKAFAALQKGVSFSQVLLEQKKLDKLIIGSEGFWLTKSEDFLYKNGSLLNKKAYGPIIESSYGFHIVQLLDKKEAKLVPFKESQNKVIDQLTGPKNKSLYSQWLRSQLKDKTIFVNQKLIDGLNVQYGNL